MRNGTGRTLDDEFQLGPENALVLLGVLEEQSARSGSE